MSEGAKITVETPGLAEAVAQLRELIQLAGQADGAGRNLAGASVPAPSGISPAPGIGAASPPSPSVPATGLSTAAGAAPTGSQVQASQFASATPAGPMGAPLPNVMMPNGSVNVHAVQQAVQAGFSHVSVAAPPVPMSNYASFGTYGVGPGGGFAPLSYDPLAQMWVDPATGVYINAPFPGGGQAGSPGAPGGSRQPQSGSSMVQALATGAIAHQISGMATQAAGAMGQAFANDDRFYPQTLLPSAITLAGVGLGMALTPGNPIGGVVGGMIAAPIAAAVQGPVDNSIANDRMIRAAAAAGFPTYGGTLPTDIANWAASQYVAGRSVDISDIQNAKSLDATTRVSFLDARQNIRYNPRNIQRRGLPTTSGDYEPGRPGWLPKGISDWLTDNTDWEENIWWLDFGDDGRRRSRVGETAKLSTEGTAGIMAAAIEDPVQSMKVLMDQAENPLTSPEERARLLGQVETIRDSTNRRAATEGELTIAGAQVGFGSALIGYQRRVGNTEDVAAAVSMQQATVERQIQLLEQKAQDLRRLNPKDPEATGLLIQANQLRLEQSLLPEETYNALREQNAARIALGQSRATVDFSRAQYMGLSANQLPWEAREAAFRNEANTLRSEIAERDRMGLPTSRAMRDDYQNRIIQAEFRAEQVQVEREQTRNQETLAIADRGASAYGLANIGRATRGGMVDQAVVSGDIQINALRERQAALEQILATSEKLTFQQRTQLETTLNTVKAERERAQAAKDTAEISARVSLGDSYSTVRANSASVDLVRVGGGPAAARSMETQWLATEDQIQSRQSAITMYRQKGFSADSPQIRGLEEELSSLRLRQAQQERQMAVIPPSPELRTRDSNLSTAYQLAQMGYGSYGDVRGILRQRLDVANQELGWMMENRRNQMENGRWTPAMEQAFTEARNNRILDAANLQKEYNTGWDQRLISEAYNLPASGRLALSRYGRREAAMYGVSHPAFGGTQADSERYQMMFPRSLAMMGTGAAANFGPRTMSLSGSDAPRVKIELSPEAARLFRVLEERGSGNLTQKFKAGMDFYENRNARDTPSG